MQAIRHDLDPSYFFSKTLFEKELMATCEPFRNPVLFDCAELGICIVSWVVGTGYKATWFNREPGGRRAKPKIAVTVTQLDGVLGNFRKRWYFALSKLGFLYPVGYEEQAKDQGGWKTVRAYYEWRRHGFGVPIRDDVLPDDSTCREAERLWRMKSISKRRRVRTVMPRQT